MPSPEATIVSDGFVYFAANGEPDVHIAVAIAQALAAMERKPDDCVMVVVTTRPDLRPAPGNSFSTNTRPKTRENKQLQTEHLTALFAKLGFVDDAGAVKVRETARTLNVTPPVISRIVNATHKVTLNHLHRLAKYWQHRGLGSITTEPSFHTLVGIACA